MSEEPTLVEALEAVETCSALFVAAGLGGLLIEAVPLGPLHASVKWCVGCGEPGVWQFYGYPPEAVAFVEDVCAVHRRPRHQRWTYRAGGDKAPA